MAYELKSLSDDPTILLWLLLLLLLLSVVDRENVHGIKVVAARSMIAFVIVQFEERRRNCTYVCYSAPVQYIDSVISCLLYTSPSPRD